MRIAGAEELGRYIKERRRELDLTQAQLSTRAGVSRRWLSGLEAGKESAELGKVLRTLYTLGVVVDLQPERQTGEQDLDDVLERYRNVGGYRRRTAIRPVTDVDIVAHADRRAES